MKSNSITSQVKAVQYSFVLILEIDYNFKEEFLYNKCVDSDVQSDPNYYCKNSIMSYSDFYLWNDEDQ